MIAPLQRFADLLRRSGIPVGTGQLLDAARALELVGVTHRRDVFWTLHCIFVSRHEQDELFAHAFALFWRDRSSGFEPPVLPGGERGERKPGAAPPRRVLEAWMEQQRRPKVEPEAKEREPTDAPAAASFREQLRRRDFEQMSADEIEQVKRLLRRMRFPWRDRPIRRRVRSPRGPQLDLRGTVQRSLRTAGEPVTLVRKERARRPPPLVVLLDISGSMERYSRMVLHFLHALKSDRDRVEVFVFGTRLTPITRHLRHRDVDVALSEVAKKVQDWGGGTRIGRCLEVFNRAWARRVLTGGAEVLLVTDGLERDDAPVLDREAKRMARFARRILWLNPLLRYEGFAPEATGVKILLSHVTEHRPVHDLASLEALAQALAG